jgi:hypothetical protein
MYLIPVGFCIYWGASGNGITIKSYLKEGYRFSFPDSREAREAIEKYNILSALRDADAKYIDWKLTTQRRFVLELLFVYVIVAILMRVIGVGVSLAGMANSYIVGMFHVVGNPFFLRYVNNFLYLMPIAILIYALKDGLNKYSRRAVFGFSAYALVDYSARLLAIAHRLYLIRKYEWIYPIGAIIFNAIVIACMIDLLRASLKVGAIEKAAGYRQGPETAWYIPAMLAGLLLASALLLTMRH